MIRTKNEAIAKARAYSFGHRYGLCVSDGMFYVGTAEELEKLPVVLKDEPEPPEPDYNAPSAHERHVAAWEEKRRLS